MDDARSQPTSSGPDNQAMEQLVTLRRSARFTSIAGVTYSILFLVSYLIMLRAPGPDSSDSEYQAFYSSSDRQSVNFVALYLLPFAGIAFLWFIVTVRSWIQMRAVKPINLLFSNVQFVSGVVFLTLLFSSAAALSIGAVAFDMASNGGSTELAREFPLFGSSLFFIFATRMGAMFVFTTTKVCGDAGIIPHWFTIVGIVVGVVMLLTSSFDRWMIVVFPLWVLMLCLLVQLHVRRVFDQKAGLIAKQDVDKATLPDEEMPMPESLTQPGPIMAPSGLPPGNGQ